MSSSVITADKETGMMRRFERSEIILHWVNAVPFLILFVTGALNMLSRFVLFSPAFLTTLRTTHKIVGALWLVSVGLTFIFIGRERNLSNLREQSCMGVSDITWMITALRSAYNPNVKMPPAGKFNTGQKINSVLVIQYLVAFSVSGALMWAYNTMLSPWFFHAAVFFMAIASVGGHLYLSFLHPSTRPGLIGIFTGMVPKSYIAHHHSLMIGAAANAYQKKMAPANGVFMFMKTEIILLIVVLIGGGFGVDALGKMQQPNFKRGFESIVNPRELSKAHSIKEIDNCKKCHEYSGELPDKKCLSCHKIIQARREANLGTHGDKKDKCIHCHKEHPGASGSIIIFDKKKFNHSMAGFKLEGKHKDVKCADCHKRKISTDGNNPAGYYVGLNYDNCLACHKDIHTGILGEKCESCHSPAGWKGNDLKFNHASAKYRLEGKHSLVACTKCHKPKTPGAALDTAVFRGVKFGRCDDCHKDPHRGKMRAGCTSCHSVQGWRNKDSKFDHGRDTRYALEGKHRAVKCTQCHASKTKDGLLDETSFRKKHKSCSDCHKDPHRGELSATCSACHSVQGWRGKELKFNHGRDTRYALEGKHRTVKCTRCHASKTKDGLLDETSFRKKHKSCSDCHKDPHRAELDATCSACHTVRGWRGKELKFDHNRNSSYPLQGNHKGLRCSQCHKLATEHAPLASASFKIKNHDCSQCHKNPHKKWRFSRGVTCADCHNVYVSWKNKKL